MDREVRPTKSSYGAKGPLREGGAGKRGLRVFFGGGHARGGGKKKKTIKGPSERLPSHLGGKGTLETLYRGE